MAAEYKVLKVIELVRQSDAGGIERYYRATIKTKGGTVLTVDLDMDEFSEVKAAPILKHRAEEADKVLKL